MQNRRRAILFVSAVATATGLGLASVRAAYAAGSDKVKIDNTLPRWLAHATKNLVTPFAVAPQTVRVYLAPKGTGSGFRRRSSTPPMARARPRWTRSAAI